MCMVNLSQLKAVNPEFSFVFIFSQFQKTFVKKGVTVFQNDLL